jgi:predicted ATPase
MLTRLEVNGFKNLADLRVEFGPFTCIAGENGAGKSNVFDAIQFLALLADRSLMEAAQEVRSTRDQRTGDPRDLFWNGHAAESPRMAFAAEMIVPHEIEDDFGRPAKATITFLRYRVEIGYEPPTGLEKVGRLVLLREELGHINLGDALRHMRFRHSVRDFRAQVLRGRRSGQAFISTSDRGGDRIITIHQDGGSRGQPRPASAVRAPATVVSTVTGADDPTILAARREMQSWRRLALEPSALRAADRYTDPRSMGTDGRHMPATLFRIATTPEHGEQTAHPEDVYARVASRLSALTGVSVRRLRVDADDARELLTIQLEEAGGIELPARSLSEGTLRFLGLCVLLEDTSVRGLICMEEPENGIHPANIPAMVELARDLAVDPSQPPGEDNPFRQVIINTHAPAVVQLVDPDDLLYAGTTAVHRIGERSVRGLSLRPLVETWRARSPLSAEPPVGKVDLLAYLTSPPGAQIKLDVEVA